MLLEDFGDESEAALHLHRLGFEGDNLLVVLGYGTPEAVFDLCALVVLVLGKDNQPVGGEGAVVILFALFLLAFHVVSEHFYFDHEECTEECHDLFSGRHHPSA